VFSSRRIQKRLAEDVAFRVLAAGNQPDFRTISDFRKLHLKALADVTPGVRDGSAEVGTSGFGWEQSKSQREQAQGHDLWTDGGGREAAAGGSARVESFEWVSAIKKVRAITEAVDSVFRLSPHTPGDISYLSYA